MTVQKSIDLSSVAYTCILPRCVACVELEKNLLSLQCILLSHSATEPGYAGDIGVIVIWLIDWLIDWYYAVETSLGQG